MMWTLFFLVATGLCSFLIFKSITNYLQFDVVTKIQLFKESPVEFPVVTLCNNNILAKNLSYKIINEVIQSVHNQTFNEYHESAKNKPFFYADMQNRYAQSSSLVAMFNPQYGDSVKKELSYFIDEMLIGCAYNQQPCSSRDFSWYFDVEGGNCFQFNSGLDSSGQQAAIKKAELAGSYNGLILQLYLGESDNINSLSRSAGMRLMVNNRTIKNRFSQGINIPTGSSTEVKLSRTFCSKLPSPYSDCQDLASYDSVLYRAILAMNLTYRQDDCFDLCFQKMNIEKCDCCNLYFPCLFGKEFCINATQFQCGFETYNSFIKSDVNELCSGWCPVECESTEISVSTSASAFPTRSFYEFYKDNEYFKRLLRNESATYESLRESVLELNIYYDSFAYTKIEQSPVSTIVDLVSNMGGTLGLLIGISLLSLVEILEIVVEMVLTVFEHYGAGKAQIEAQS